MENSRPKPARMEETLEGGRGPPWAVVPLERERERENLARIGVQKRLHGTQILMEVNTQGTTYAKKIVFHTAYNKIAGSVLKQHNINYQIK